MNIYIYIYYVCLSEKTCIMYIYIYILVEVKSFPDGVAEICWKKPMDLRQMMMIHPHFRGELTVFSRLMMWGNFNLEITIWMIHLMAWFWKKAFDTMTSSGQHDWYSSMVPQMFFKCFFSNTATLPGKSPLNYILFFCGLNFNDLEVNFKFAAWSFSITAQNSSLKADCGWKLWFPRLPGLYFVHTKTKTAKSTRRPSKKNASRPPRAAAKMPSGCWSLEGVGEMELTCFLVEKAILWSEGKTWMHHFYRYMIHVQMLIISRMW